jgi:hypothetical protein
LSCFVNFGSCDSSFTSFSSFGSFDHWSSFGRFGQFGDFGSFKKQPKMAALAVQERNVSEMFFLVLARAFNLWLNFLIGLLC